MTTTVVTLPANAYFADAKLTLRRASVTLRSPYTGKRQVLSMPFAVWVFEGTLIKMTQANAAQWRAFLVDLDGQANAFRLPVPGAEVPLSGYTGTAGYVSAPNQTGTTLTTTGWAANTLILKKGDYFTVNDELKVALADVTTNSGGAATLSFKPRLRSAPATGSTITTSNPTVLLCAQDDDVASWKLSVPVNHDIEIKAIEAI